MVALLSAGSTEEEDLKPQELLEASDVCGIAVGIFKRCSKTKQAEYAGEQWDIGLINLLLLSLSRHSACAQQLVHETQLIQTLVHSLTFLHPAEPEVAVTACNILLNLCSTSECQEAVKNSMAVVALQVSVGVDVNKRTGCLCKQALSNSIS